MNRLDMSWFQKPLVYLLASSDLVPTGRLKTIVEQALAGGVGMVQMREKETSRLARRETVQMLRRVTDKAAVPLIINDNVQLARDYGADGVHLGQDDMKPGKARACLGSRALIGVSTHSLREIIQADGEDVDMIGLGPMFATKTKKNAGTPRGRQLVADYFQSGTRLLPLFIGGINAANAQGLRARGLRHVAVSSYILAAKDPGEAAEKLLEVLR